MTGYFFTSATDDELDLMLELWYDLDAFSLQAALDTAHEVTPDLLSYAATWDGDAFLAGNDTAWRARCNS